MGKFWGRVRKGFSFASDAETLWGWLSPYIPQIIFVFGGAILTAVVGLMQGMTPAGALLLAVFTAACLAAFIHYGLQIRDRLRASRHPPVHKQKMLDLADALAELKSLVMHPGNWSRVDPLPHQDNHAARYQAARTRVDKLMEEISYDKETRSTAVDFAHLCNMVVSDLLSRRDYREHWAELEKVSSPIFHRLHQGRGVDRSKIPWPQWIRDSDAGAELDAVARTKRGTETPPLKAPKESVKDQRRRLIFEARRAAQQYDDSRQAFRTYIEPKSCYIALKRHLDPAFVKEVERSGMTSYVRGRGAGLPAMSARFLAELDRLAEQWGLE